MKKYLKEIIILIIQLMIFYLIPLIAKPTDAIGMVFLIMIVTFILSIIIGNVSKEKLKYFYPVLVSIIFIPSVFIYYNESALIHSVWYLIISIIGLIIGTFINKIINKK